MDEIKIQEMLQESEKRMQLLIQESFKHLYQFLDLKFKEIHERLDRIESNSNEDVVALLKQIEKQTKTLSFDVEYLAEKVGKHEMILNRFKQN
jgi:adenylosuccinate lyase